MSRIVRRPAANRDLIAIFRYYAREAGIRIADRFFAQAEATFNSLADTPGMGTSYEPTDPLYADLRCFSVFRFRRYFVFYRPIPDGIEVYRVLHGARDIHGILAKEFGFADVPEEGEADDQ